METSTKYLNKIIEAYGSNWLQQLDSYIKEDNTADTEDDPLFSDFISAYREATIDCKTSEIKKVEKLISNDLVFSQLNAYIEKRLSAYRAIEPLRIIDKTDPEKASKMVDLIYEQAIIRHNPDLDERFSEYGLADQDTFVGIISVLISLTTFIVTRNLYSSAIYDAVRLNTRLTASMCKHIADKIDQNFDQIRFRLIMEKLYES